MLLIFSKSVTKHCKKWFCLFTSLEEGDPIEKAIVDGIAEESCEIVQHVIEGQSLDMFSEIVLDHLFHMMERQVWSVINFLCDFYNQSDF